MTRAEALAELQKLEAGQPAQEHDIRAVARELADAAEQEGGTAARLAMWRRLFRAGVFRQPPLSGVAYDAWCELQKDAKRSIPCPVAHDVEPFFSVLMPVYNPDPQHLTAAIESVLAQSWRQWELCMADDASTDPAVYGILKKYAEQDLRIKVTFRKSNGHISEASNTALDMACAPWCALLDHDDLLEPQALAVMAAAIGKNPEAQVFFSDEDQIEMEQGHAQAFNPMFKHGFDPDLLLTCNCVSHFGVYSTEMMRSVGGFRKGLEGAQDHDLALRCLTHVGGAAFCHVPQVLYHWRRHEGSTSVDWATKPYVRAAALQARHDYASVMGLDAEFSFQENSVYMNVHFAPPHPAPLLSLCLLTTEGLVPAAVREVVARTSLPKREILLVVRQQDRAQAERVAAEVRARVLTVADDDNIWSAANVAATAARGAVLSFVQVGDIPLAPDWCERALGALCRPGVAVTGCRGVDKNGFLIHVGYAVERGPNSLRICPAYGGLHSQSGGYFHWAHLLHGVMALPLSGMFCTRSLFEELQGFMPHFAELSPSDFCLRAAHARQQRCVILPDIDLLSFHALPPVQASPCFLDQWPTLGVNPPCQSPLLSWTPGGWTFLS